VIGRCGFLWGRSRGAGLFLGADSLGDLGLVGGVYLRCVRRPSVVSLQRAKYGTGQRLFPRVAHTGGCGDDRSDRAHVLFPRGGRFSKQACYFAFGYLRPCRIDGERLSLLQLEKFGSAEATPFLDAAFRIYFDHLDYRRTPNYVLYDIPVIYLIGSSLMVFNQRQTPAGEERGDG